MVAQERKVTRIVLKYFGGKLTKHREISWFEEISKQATQAEENT